MIKENLVKMIETSLKSNWDLPAFSNYQGEEFSYEKVAKKILWLHFIFEKKKIKSGDKIAVIGKNSMNWAITYLATISYDAVIVPILPDFAADDIHHIVNHSETVMLFAANEIFDEIDDEKMPALSVIFSLTDFSVLFERKNSMTTILEKAEQNDKSNRFLKAENFQLPEVGNDKLASIVYTSGTTGFSKGVMLTHNNLAANLVYAHKNMPLKAGDNIVSFMPLAHSYGCAFEFLFPFTLGCHITFLSKIPSPKIIVKAFKEIRPQLILSVPLIIEKIYKKQIKPQIDKPPIKIILKLPLLNKLIYRKIYNKLAESFGGNFHEIVIGGAALNKDVEKFFRKLNFPYTIGYGMTECAPLISYSPWKVHKLGSVGKIVDTLQIKIDSENSQETVGEILVCGENVMSGYFKNEEITRKTIDENGWLHTGDMGIIDKDGFIFIKGRSKNMILDASGQNIYPEEIESKLNNFPFVQESIVVEKDKKLVALIYPDYEAVDASDFDDARLEEYLEKIRKDINAELPAYSKISKMEIRSEEFDKTPTKKIKRFLYQNMR